ncbi:MAG TPA: acyl carrier protein [Conexibacter sp.]|nr:acyl carrier protein [Conexibacter sp.]
MRPLHDALALRATVREVWTELLGSAPVDAEADFFDAGGHSLLALTLIDELHERVGVRVPFRRFWVHATYGALCEIVECEMAEAGGD